MIPSSTVRTPYHKQPITIVMKAIRQKTYRKLHCYECGQPFADISDKVIIAFDGETPVSRYEPDRIGMVEIHCTRHQCKQYYRMEFAV